MQTKQEFQLRPDTWDQGNRAGTRWTDRQTDRESQAPKSMRSQAEGDHRGSQSEVT